MENVIKMLQGYCNCMLDEKIIYITSQHGLMVEFDYKAGKLKVLSKERLKYVASNIVIINGVIYIITSKGAQIAETKIENTSYVYYDINNEGKKYDDLVYLCNFAEVIYLFSKKNKTLVTFDTKTKKKGVIHINVTEQYEDVVFEHAYFYEGKLCMFSSSIRKMITYSFEKKYIIDEKELPEISKILYVVYECGALFMLADNTVYEMKEAWMPVARLDSDEHPVKMCITNHKIWLFPGEGQNIYVFSRKENKWEIFKDYPKDFAYSVTKKGSKYMRRCNSKETICWMMHRSNYFLKIDKISEHVECIKPRLENGKVLYECISVDGVFRETELSLRNYVDYLIIKDNY